MIKTTLTSNVPTTYVVGNVTLGLITTIIGWPSPAGTSEVTAHEAAYNHGDISQNTAHRNNTNNPHGVTTTQIGAIPNTVDIGRIMNPLVHLPLKHAEEITGTQAAAGAKYSGTASFTRASTATYIDPLDGLLKTAAIDTPRFERMADGGVGLLVEGSSTNLLLQSAAFDTTSWTKGAGATVTANTGTAPDGTATADKITFPDGANVPYIYQIPTASTWDNRTFTFSMWIRRVSGSGTITIRIGDAGEADSTSKDITASLTTSWQRFYITTTYNAGTTNNNSVWVFRSGSVGLDEIEVWGAQLEELPFASSYIPTTTAAVTRAADDFSISLPFNIVDGSYTVLYDVERDPNSKGTRIDIRADSVSNVFASEWDDGSGNSKYYFTTTALYTGVVSNAVTATGFVSDGTNVKLYLDNVLKATGSYSKPATQNASSGLIGLNRQVFGGTSIGSCLLRNLRIYDVALTDEEMKVA